MYMNTTGQGIRRNHGMVERMISSEENWCEIGQLDAINNKVKSENHNLREK